MLVVNPFKAANTVADPLFTSVSLLMTGEGSENGTVFKDRSSYNKATPTAYGAPFTTAAQYPYGNSSIRFSNNQMLLYPWSSDLRLPGDFCIELWYFPISISGSIVLNLGGGINVAWPTWELTWDFSDTPYKYLNFAASSTNTSIDIGSETGIAGRVGEPIVGAWNFIMIKRSGNTWSSQMNGINGFNFTNSGVPYNSSPRGLQIGGRSDYTWNTAPATNTCINGYIKDLRITTSSRTFAIPTAPFPIF